MYLFASVPVVKALALGWLLAGDWSLSISPVKLEDEAEYQCQVSGGPGHMPIRSVVSEYIPFLPPILPIIPGFCQFLPPVSCPFFQIHGTWWCLVPFGEMYLTHWRRIKKVLFRFFLTIRLNLRALRCLKVASLSHLLLTQVQESEGDGENTSGAPEDSTGFYFYMQMRVHKFKILKGIFIQLKTL